MSRRWAPFRRSLEPYGLRLCPILVLGLLGCEARLSLGSRCELNTDCPPGLVCGVAERCRTACRESRDCAGGERCLRDPVTGTPACSLPSDSCSAGTCTAGLVCLEGACVNACATDAECPDGRCATGACVPILAGTDAGRLDAGMADAPTLDAVTTDAGPLDTGAGTDAPTAIDAPIARDAPLLPPLRLVAPLSTSRVSSRRPEIRWALRPAIDGARLTFCTTRACTTTLSASDHVGPVGAPPAPLSPGVVFFRIEGMSGGTVVTQPSAVWEIQIPATDHAVTTALSRFPDFDGDGLGDLAVSAAPTSAPGSVLVWYARDTTPPSMREPDAVLVPSDANSVELGLSVAAGGDVNGDGFGDLVVGSSGSSIFSGTQPRFYVFHGGPSGLETAPTIVLSGSGTYGIRVLGLGDVDGDGYGDVAVSTDYGPIAVVVLAGSATGIDGSALGTLSPHTGDVSWGVPLAAGDFDGDGRSDLVVSAWSNSFAEGRIYVYSGPSLSERRIVEPRPGIRQSWGQALAALDADGDGISDLAVGEHLAQQIFVLRGGVGGLVETSTPWLTSTLSGYGRVLSAAGDLDGDGDEELLVGGASERASIVATNGAAAAADHPIPFPGDCPATCGFGSALGALGDRDGDGFDDVVITGPAGRIAYVAHGSATVGSLRRPVAVLRSEAGFGRATTAR